MNNGGYQPYMFGNSFGMGNGGGFPQQTSGNSYAGQNTRRDGYNVRDCMYWPASLGAPDKNTYAQQQQPPNYGGMGGMTPMSGTPYFATPQGAMMGGSGSSEPYVFHAGYTDDYGTGEPMQQMAPTAPVKAYMSTPGDGGQAGKPIQIPCHMGAGPGQLPQVPNMPALGYKVTVPQVAPTAPLDFEIKQ